MTKSTLKFNAFAFFFCISLFSNLPCYSQFYEWAYGSTDAKWGQGGQFITTDRHLNGYFRGVAHTCQLCVDNYIFSIDAKGFENWRVSFMNSSVLQHLRSIDADHDENRYLLVKFYSLPVQVGSFIISDSNAIVKYNKFGNPVRVTALPEDFFQLKTDSIGNMFISNGYKVRRYNKLGNFIWEYNTAFNHTLDIDNQRIVYLLGDDHAVALNINGGVKYSLNISGLKVIDPTGKLFVTSSSGTIKYSRNGNFIWHVPSITGPVLVNKAGFVYEFVNDSIKKFSPSGAVLIWKVSSPPYDKVMNDMGDFYIGGNYDANVNNIEICPFKLPDVSPMATWSGDQVWYSKFNTTAPVPFQAAVFTGQVETGSWLDGENKACSGMSFNGYGGPLFTYCTNFASQFPANNVFSIEISDPQGDFANAINIGPVPGAVIPDTLPHSTNYRVRVVSSTPGVHYYPNKPTYMGNAGVEIVPDIANISVSGPVSICDGQSVQLELFASDPNANIIWNNLPAGVPYPPAGTTSVTLGVNCSVSAYISNYYCYFKFTDTLQLSVNPRPNPVVTSSGPTSFCAGDSVTLTVSDVDLSVVRWRNNGTPIPGAVLPDFVATSSGNYTARVINSYGCARASNVVAVSVVCRNQGGASVVSQRLNIYPNPVSKGANITLDGILSGIYELSISDISGKQWIKQTVEIPDDAGLEFSADGMKSGIYLVSLTSSGQRYVEKLIITD